MICSTIMSGKKFANIYHLHLHREMQHWSQQMFHYVVYKYWCQIWSEMQFAKQEPRVWKRLYACVFFLRPYLQTISINLLALTPLLKDFWQFSKYKQFIVMETRSTTVYSNRYRYLQVYRLIRPKSLKHTP